jgi:hypothetical protein
VGNKTVSVYALAAAVAPTASFYRNARQKARGLLLEQNQSDATFVNAWQCWIWGYT